MFKYSKDGVSVLTILDTRRAKINGLFPVKVQGTNRERLFTKKDAMCWMEITCAILSST